MKNKYRIIRDDFAGFEVQVKRWWFPFCWFQCWGHGDTFTNTHRTIEEAEAFVRFKKRKVEIVKYVD